MEVEQWWRSNGGGDRERNVGLEGRERESHTSDFVGFKDRFRRK